MIGYFPKPYKDEIFYSIITRCHIHTGEEKESESLENLLGMKRKLNIEIPFGIDTLVKKVNIFSSVYTKKYFINNHTMIPFLKPFQNLNWMDGEYVKERRNKRLFINKPYEVPFKENLFYCKECLKEQISMYGEGYWNRIHQLPGMLVCTKHKTLLTEQSGSFYQLNNGDLFLPNLNGDNKETKVDQELMDSLLNLAEDIQTIFELNLIGLSSEVLFGKYETLLEINNIAYPIKERKDKLKSLLVDFYPINFLKLLNSSVENEEQSWLENLSTTLKIEKLHPVRHLLLIRMLCGSIRDFFENEYKYEPFGEGPWVCMNPLADHYLERTVEKVEISIHGLNRKIQGDMMCSCGFVYRLREWEKDPLSVPYFNNRIMKKGQVWEERFNEFLEQKLTIQEIARRTKMTRPTIRKLIRDWKARGGQPNSHEQMQTVKTEIYKQEWLNYLELNPDYTRQQLSNLNRAVYAWLSKHDREWLEKNSPPSLKGKNSVFKEFSIENDLKYLNKVKEVNNNWKYYEISKGKLIRKTNHLLRRFIGLNQSSKSKSDEFFPLTLEFIETISESVMDFRKRRITYVLRNKYRNQMVTIYQVAEAVGIREALRKYKRESSVEGLVLQQFLEEQVTIHNQQLNNL